MPQACKEDRATMCRWFGSIDPDGPQDFLKSHGFILLPTWCWVLPAPSHTVSCYEQACILVLVLEWDYGFVMNDNNTFICLCGRKDDV